jgi:hypothetical protein
LLKQRFPQVRAEVKPSKLLVIEQPGILMIAVKG